LIVLHVRRRYDASMRLAPPLAALIAAFACGCAKPPEVRPEPAGSASAPIPITMLDVATATADASAGAEAVRGGADGSSTAPEPVVEPEDAGPPSAVCAPMPARRPVDFSTLYEVYTAPIRGNVHAFGQIVGSGGACHDDGGGPAFYRDGLALRCVHGDAAALDHLYAVLVARGFTRMRQSIGMLHGPRHVARRVVVRYGGKRCELVDAYGKPLERRDEEGFSLVMDAIGEVLHPKPTSAPP
jgi:hypothetical protein